MFFNKYSRFHKGYFILFIALNTIIFIASIFEKNVAFSVFDVLAYISTVTGVLSAIYTARGELGAFTWGIVNTFTYIFVAWHSQIYGQAILYIFFETPMQVVSYYIWKRNISKSNGQNVEPRSLNLKKWICIIIAFLIVWISYAIFINHLPQILNDLVGDKIKRDPLYIIDSLSVTMTITAVMLTCLRYIEQWYFWIATTAIGVLLFIVSLFDCKFSLNSLSALVMWSELLSNSIYGYIVWKKMNSHNEKAIA
ncbi:MAG: nicotinamide riboside transporter PnuC [Sarcina sp.]